MFCGTKPTWPSSEDTERKKVSRARPWPVFRKIKAVVLEKGQLEEGLVSPSGGMDGT